MLAVAEQISENQAASGVYYSEPVCPEFILSWSKDLSKSLSFRAKSRNKEQGTRHWIEVPSIAHRSNSPQFLIFNS